MLSYQDFASNSCEPIRTDFDGLYAGELVVYEYKHRVIINPCQFEASTGLGGETRWSKGWSLKNKEEILPELIELYGESIEIIETKKREAKTRRKRGNLHE